MQAEYAYLTEGEFAMETNRISSPSLIFNSPCRQNASTTIEWLQSHYEEKEGISLPRGAMFGHYLDYCHQVAVEPINQATFGKIIRTVFPEVKTRRLGTRGQSRYHYYGLTIKDSSPYKDIMISAQRVNNYLGEPSGKGMYSRTVAQTSLPTTPSGGREPLHGSILLQEFPSASSIAFPEDIKDAVAVFLMMYRHHSQRLVDTILRANFSEVKEIILHFWQSLPNHILAVLRRDHVVRTVALCDVILYRAVTALLIPGVLQSLPASLMTAIRTFGRDVVGWTSEALKAHFPLLRQRKLQVVRSFSQRLWRMTAISHMASVARNVLEGSDLTTKLSTDWKNLELEVIIKELVRDLRLTPEGRQELQQYMNEFFTLLQSQVTLEQYVDWIKAIFTRTVKETLDSSTEINLQEASRLIILRWFYISKVIIRELTLVSADMFGPYHLLSMLFQDCIMMVAEEWQHSALEHTLRGRISGDSAAEFIPEWHHLQTKPTFQETLRHNRIKDLCHSAGKGFTGYDEMCHPQSFALSSDKSAIYRSRQPDPHCKPKQVMAAHHSSMLVPPKMERCSLSQCPDDMGRQQHPFDSDNDPTSPDDPTARALDLSLNYSQSLSEDDALVDQVISKGYATLDDCHQSFSPMSWKQYRSYRHSSDQGMPMQRRTGTKPSTLSRACQGEESHAQGAYGVSPLPLAQHQASGIQDHETYRVAPSLYPSEQSHVQGRMRSVNQQRDSSTTQVSVDLTAPPALRSDRPSASETLSFVNYVGHSYMESPSMSHEITAIQEGRKAHTSPENNLTASGFLGHRQVHEPMTHVSGSLQVAPLNPRKKWMLEAESQNLRQKHVSHIQLI